MSSYCFRERTMLFLLVLLQLCGMHISVQNCLPQVDPNGSKDFSCKLAQVYPCLRLHNFFPCKFQFIYCPLTQVLFKLLFPQLTKQRFYMSPHGVLQWKQKERIHTCILKPELPLVLVLDRIGIVSSSQLVWGYVLDLH